MNVTKKQLTTEQAEVLATLQRVYSELFTQAKYDLVDSNEDTWLSLRLTKGSHLNIIDLIKSVDLPEFKGDVLYELNTTFPSFHNSKQDFADMLGMNLEVLCKNDNHHDLVNNWLDGCVDKYAEMAKSYLYFYLYNLVHNVYECEIDYSEANITNHKYSSLYTDPIFL